MTTQKTTTYIPSKRPTLPASEAKWLEEELKKLERTLRSIEAAIKELQDLHP